MNLNNKWLWMLGVVGLMGCGVSSQSDAVDVTARNVCAAYKDCDRIGSGKAYANENDCLIEQKAAWNNFWSVEDCDDHINSKNFDSCQEAVEVLSCGNLIDRAVLLDKCSRDRVCSGNP